MSSRSRRSPQPGSRPPHLLITEVPTEDRAGESGEEPSNESSVGSEALAEVRYLPGVDDPDPPKRGAGAKAASAAAKRSTPKRKAAPKRAVAAKSSSAAAATAKTTAKTGTKTRTVGKTKAAATKSASSAASAAAKAPGKIPAKIPAKTAAKVSSREIAKVGGGEVAPSLAAGAKAKPGEAPAASSGPEVRVRRIHRRDLNRTWEFLKMVFRDVNRETVEYQRPRSKMRFVEVYEEDGEQLLFEIEDKIVGYAECAFDASGADNWINPRYFDKRGMRPLYVDELAVHPDYQGRGVGAFMLDQVQHLARVRGCTHLVLEVAENNKSALSWYHKRNFFRLDAAIFLAQKVPAEPELLPPRRLPQKRLNQGKITKASSKGGGASKKSHRSSAASRSRKK